MDPRLQAGLELQLEKQAQQEHDSSLSGVLGQYFKQADSVAQEGLTGALENVTKNVQVGGGALYLTRSETLAKMLKNLGQSEWGKRKRVRDAAAAEGSVAPVIAKGSVAPVIAKGSVVSENEE